MFGSHLTWRENTVGGSSSSNYIDRLWKRQNELEEQEEALIERVKQNSYSLPRTREVIPSAMSEDGGSRVGNVFHSRVRPAINRGKTLLIASDPERHLQMMKERLALQEKRNRIRTPLKLNPLIEVKSLQKSDDLISPMPMTLPSALDIRGGLRQPSRGQAEAEKLAEIWNRQTPIVPRPTANCDMSVYHSDLVLDQMPINTMLNYTRNILQLDPIEGTPSATPYRTDNTHKPEDGKKKSRRQQKRVCPAFGIYNGRRLAARYDPTLILEATRLLEGEETPETRGYSTSVCTTDTRPVTRNSSRHTGAPHQTILTLPAGLSSPSPAGLPRASKEPDRLIPSVVLSDMSSGDTRNTLMVHVPSIDCTPPTPDIPITKRRGKRERGVPETDVGKPSRSMSLQKAQKQRELRERELKNLFADISELNSVNENIQNVIN